MINKALRYLVPNPGTLIVLGLFLWAQAVGAVPGKTPVTQSTTIPRLISYQGRLTDAVGDPVANGNYRMVFSLYCSQTGGEAFWTEDRDATNTVPVSDGFFNVLLGQLTSMPASFPCPDGNVYLGIRVDPDPTEMDPRELLASVPYAFQAVEVPDGSITTDKIADEAVTQAKLGADVSLVPPDGSITTEKLADDAVTSSKIGDGAVKSRHAALTIKKASGTNSFDIGGTGDWRDVQSLSINILEDECPVACTLIIDAWIDMQRNSSGCQEPAFRCVVDDVAESEILRHRTCGDNASNDLSCTISGRWVKDVSAGSHTVKIQFDDNGGGMWFRHRHLTVMIIAQ